MRVKKLGLNIEYSDYENMSSMIYDVETNLFYCVEEKNNNNNSNNNNNNNDSHN